jgi:hypothetical protein
MLEAKGSTALLKEFRQVRPVRRKLESFMGWGLSFLIDPQI